MFAHVFLFSLVVLSHCVLIELSIIFAFILLTLLQVPPIKFRAANGSLVLAAPVVQRYIDTH